MVYNVPTTNKINPMSNSTQLTGNQFNLPTIQPPLINSHSHLLKEDIAISGLAVDLANYLIKESIRSEPADLRSREIKSRESQVVNYTEQSLRLKKRLCDRAFETTQEREKNYFESPSEQTLSHLLDQIQTTYLKYWELQRVVEFRPYEVPRKLLTTPDDLEKFENHIVDFFLTCSPFENIQAQDLFLTCIWYHSTKDSKQESHSANYTLISNRILLFFQNNEILNTSMAKIKKRVTCCDPADQKLHLLDDDKLPEAILMVIEHSLQLILRHRNTKTIKFNIKKFITENELFKEHRLSTENKCRFDRIIHALGLLEFQNNILHQLNPEENLQSTQSRTQPDLDPESLLFHALHYCGSSQVTYSSPDIGLAALEKLLKFIHLPEFRKKVIGMERYVSTPDSPCSDWMVIYNFLIHGDTDALINVHNKDARSYLSAIFNYLRNNYKSAETELKKSRLPEASWLHSKIQKQKGNLDEAIKHSKIALQRGLDAANMQLALLLIMQKHPIKKDIIHLLEKAIEHYNHLNIKDFPLYIQGIIDEIELDLDEEQRALPPPPKSKKHKAKKKSEHQKSTKTRDMTKPKFSKEPYFSDNDDSFSASTSDERVQEDHITRISRSKLASISLSVTQALHCNDYDRAYQLLTSSCQATSLTLQQASFAHMDLWNLRVLSRDSEYLEALYESAQQEHKDIKFNILAQTGKTLIEYGLNRQECENILLTENIGEVKTSIQLLTVDKALKWLCCLHACDQTLDQYKDKWKERPIEIVRNLLKEFEHGLTLTFVTSSFLSFLGHIHGDMATDCTDKKERNRLKQRAKDFYKAANLFNKWRNSLKSDRKLSCRIAAATPLGNIQKIRAQQKKA